MLTNLDFLTPGSAWPPKCERKRLRRYRDNKMLFEGEHPKVFKEIWMRLFRHEMQLSIELVLNWPKRLSTLWADFLLGETPGLSDSNNEVLTDYLQELITKTSFWRRSYAAALDCSRFGDTVLKARRDTKGRVKVSVLPPYHWFPVVSEEDAQEIEYHVLAWPSSSSSLWEQAATTLYVEIHSNEKVIFRRYQMPSGFDPVHGSTLGTLLEEREENNLAGRNYIVHIPNLQRSDSIYGLDDYDDLTSVMQEIEVRFAQVARVLDAHADPKMYGPDRTVVDEETGIQRADLGDYVPVEADEVQPGYITWDGHLEMSFTQIDKMMQQFYMLSETSPAVFGEIKSGLAESGSALKRLMMAPLAKVNRVRLGFDEGLREVIKVAAALDGKTKVEPKIEWQDGLPDDETERTANEVAAVSAGISSKRSAIKRLYKMNNQQAEDELKLIEDETPVVVEPDNLFDDPEEGE